jgi:hypothetical protein
MRGEFLGLVSVIMCFSLSVVLPLQARRGVRMDIAVAGSSLVATVSASLPHCWVATT